VPYTRSLVVHNSARLVQHTQNMLGYKIVYWCVFGVVGSENDSFIANFPEILPVKKIWKYSENWHSYRSSLVQHFFGTQCRCIPAKTDRKLYEKYCNSQLAFLFTFTQNISFSTNIKLVYAVLTCIQCFWQHLDVNCFTPTWTINRHSNLTV